MLIRSQDKETLINLDNSIVIDIMDIEGVIKVVCSYSCEDYIIGHYSTKEKALKVLDMIQEAYADAEFAKGTIAVLARAFSEAPETEKDEEFADVIRETFKETTYFQMPADNEVEA